MLVSMLPGYVGKLIVFGCLSAAAGGSVCAAQMAARVWKLHLGDDDITVLTLQRFAGIA
jgi:hypothetical protein